MLLIITSSLKLELKNFEITYPKKDNKIINKNFAIYLKGYVLGKVRIAKINLTNLKMEKNIKRKIEENKGNIDAKATDLLKSMKIELENVNLEAYIGFEDAAFTAILIGTIYTIIYVLVGSQMNKINKIIKTKDRDKIMNKDSKNNSKYKIKITPVYNVNIVNAKFECIIKMKLIHIIHIIYILNKKKKRRVEKDGRTSNRGAYAYSDE